MINSFTMVFSEVVNYSSRIRNGLIINFTISLVVFFIATKSSSVETGLLFGLFVFLGQFLVSKRWDKFFITKIKLDKGELSITYLEKGVERMLTGRVEDFAFKKRFGINKTRTPYLLIFHKEIELIRQYEIGEWNEQKMDEIIGIFMSHP